MPLTYSPVWIIHVSAIAYRATGSSMTRPEIGDYCATWLAAGVATRRYAITAARNLLMGISGNAKTANSPVKQLKERWVPFGTYMRYYDLLSVLWSQKKSITFFVGGAAGLPGDLRVFEDR